MEKQELINYLSEFLPKELSVDLYFVFKTGAIYTQYKADPDQELREELIFEFSKELGKYANIENPYPLTDIYDDNEYQDYHLFFDSINNNQIAQSVFNFDRANVLNYSKDIGSLSKIYGFLIELSDGEKTISIYKRNQPTNAINPDRVINFFSGVDNKFKLLEQNAVYMTKTIDLFKIDDYLLINSRAVYEFQFGFVAELQTKAEHSFIELAATNAFEFNEELGDKISKLPKNDLKKLANSVKNNPILNKGNYDVILKQAKKYINHKFDCNETGQIIIKSQKELKILIAILNRDYNYNEATREKFLTKNKKLLK